MTPESEGRDAASVFRTKHRLGVQPLGDLVALIEKTTGHDVSVLDAIDPDEHGLAMRDPVREVAYIGVARTRNPMRQRSTLAHELAHVLFADWKNGEDPGAQKRQEQRADAFARHLLVPSEGLKEFLGGLSPLSEAELSVVVQWFLVSPAIAAIALHDCGYIDASAKQKWMTLSTPRLATRFGWIDQYESLQQDSDRTRSPQRLLARAIAGYEEGVVTAQTVATLRGISVKATIEQLEAAGIIPVNPVIPWMTAADIPRVPVDLNDLEGESPEGFAK